MALIVTPSQLQQRAELYHQLGALLSAGVALPRALEMLQRNPPSRSLRQLIGQLQVYIGHGETFTEAVEKMGSWIPAFDMALIEAGEKSGRLDACCKLLAIYYRERGQLARKVITDLMYPAFVFHFAIFLFPFLTFFRTGNLLLFLSQTFGLLIPLYAIVIMVILACQGRHGEKWRSLIERILRPVPVLGKARQHLAVARLAIALEALINAGVPLISGWELAAKASGSPALYRRVLSWKIPLETGSTPAELLSAAPEFPEMFANLYATGENSGTLDENLRRLHAHYQEEGSRKLHRLAMWTPQIVYMAVVIMVAIKVLSFYTGYFNQLNQIMK